MGAGVLEFFAGLVAVIKRWRQARAAADAARGREINKAIDKDAAEIDKLAVGAEGK